MKIIKNLSIALLLSALMGCQSAKFQMNDFYFNHEKDYLKSSLLSPLLVPEGLTRQISSNYPVPLDLPQISALEPVSLVPPGFGELS